MKRFLRTAAALGAAAVLAVSVAGMAAATDIVDRDDPTAPAVRAPVEAQVDADDGRRDGAAPSNDIVETEGTVEAGGPGEALDDGRDPDARPGEVFEAAPVPDRLDDGR